MPLSLPSQNHRYTDEREIPNRFATSRGLSNRSFSIKLPPLCVFPSLLQESWQSLRQKVVLVTKGRLHGRKNSAKEYWLNRQHAEIAKKGVEKKMDGQA